jgi:ABC-type multidrug transport system permease subunit
MGLTTFTTVGLSAIIPVFSAERNIMYREHPSGYYSTLAFATVMMLIDWPWLLFQSVLYNCIAFWMFDLLRTFENWM